MIHPVQTDKARICELLPGVWIRYPLSSWSVKVAAMGVSMVFFKKVRIGKNGKYITT